MAPAGPRPASRRPAEAGVALLIVLVVLFIVAVLMTDISLTATTARRSAHNASTEFLMNAAVDRKFHVGVAQIRYENPVHEGYSTLDDRWALKEYTNEEKESPGDGASGAADAGAGEEGVKVYGEGGKGQVTATLRRLWDPAPDLDLGIGEATPIEDEDRKFNLYLLLHPDPEVRGTARERFSVLLDQFRQDTPLDVTPTVADELREQVVGYLERDAPAGGQAGIPVRRKDPWWILTPDELCNAPGLEDKVHGLSAKGILFDSQDPREYRDYQADPEGRDEPPAYPGLLRYVTVWSGDAFKKEFTKDSKFPVNLNTADRTVLRALFHREGPNFEFVEKLLKWRLDEKEGAGTGAPASSGEDAQPTVHNRLEKVADLEKAAEGSYEAIRKKNFETEGGRSLLEFLTGVRSSTFSLFIRAEREVEAAADDEEDGRSKESESVRLFRFVVRRKGLDPKTRLYGYQTILREERDDPWFPPAEATER